MPQFLPWPMRVIELIPYVSHHVSHLMSAYDDARAHRESVVCRCVTERETDPESFETRAAARAIYSARIKTRTRSTKAHTTQVARGVDVRRASYRPGHSPGTHTAARVARREGLRFFRFRFAPPPPVRASVLINVFLLHHLLEHDPDLRHLVAPQRVLRQRALHAHLHHLQCTAQHAA